MMCGSKKTIIVTWKIQKVILKGTLVMYPLKREFQITIQFHLIEKKERVLPIIKKRDFVGIFGIGNNTVEHSIY